MICAICRGERDVLDIAMEGFRPFPMCWACRTMALVTETWALSVVLDDEEDAEVADVCTRVVDILREDRVAAIRRAEAGRPRTGAEIGLAYLQEASRQIDHRYPDIRRRLHLYGVPHPSVMW